MKYLNKNYFLNYIHGALVTKCKSRHANLITHFWHAIKAQKNDTYTCLPNLN